MRKTRVEDVGHFPSSASVEKPIGEAINADGFALNYFEVEPGGTFSTTLHAHLDQEEAFYIVTGTATFGTDDGEVTVRSDEAIRFAPGEYQHGYNAGDSRVVALAIGAPKESTNRRVECPECGVRDSPQITWLDDGDARIFECGACGYEIAYQQ